MEYSKQTIFFTLLVSVLFIPAATADTNLNITISEVVFQNVTFAADFNLVENRTYALITGAIDVDNPGSVTVADTYIKFRNVENLVTPLVYDSGRDGFQVVYPDVIGANLTVPSTIDATFTDLGLDIDEDGQNDSVRVNSTHIIFNVTSEYELRSYAFENSTNTSLDISTVPTPLDMTFNITSLRDDLEYNDNVTFANIRINGTVTTANQLVPAEVTLQVNDTTRNYAVVHIPELRPAQSTRFVYNISSVTVEPPLDLESNYTNPEFNTKVLAGETFGIRYTAENIATVGDLIIVNVTIDAESVTVQNGSESETFNFTLHNLSTDPVLSDDWPWVNTASNRSWGWFVNNGTIPVGTSYNISFDVRAPDTVPTSNTYQALTTYLQYTIDTTASTFAVDEVRARAAVEFSETKRIVSPQDNESNNNVTWESIPEVTRTENITYTLEKISLWVTEVRDPNQVANNLTQDYFPNYTLNSTQTTFTGAPWYFNFTDGSSDANPPPIVWIQPYWIIRNAENQILNSSFTINGTDLYMNYIYVVNGYWLEVDKAVLDVGDGLYDIRINVTNRGNGYTPQNMTVTVFDFIPEAFDASGFSPMWNNASNVTGQFEGTAYQWDVGLRTNLSTSFSPNGAADGLDVYFINYSVNGTGDFAVSDLYIVGLDPRLVDGASANELVAVVSSIASTSREVIYLAVVVFLIGINVANFMMTNKISKKLDR